MRKAIGNFLSNNFITIMMWISILFIGTTDSIIPLIIYSTVIHALILILIYGLYVDGIVIFPERLYRHTFLLFRIIESLVLLTVLILSKHWYTLCISLFYIFLVFVYVFDYKQQTEE